MIGIREERYASPKKSAVANLLVNVTGVFVRALLVECVQKGVNQKAEKK